MARKKNDPVIVKTEDSLTHDGQAVAKFDDKVVFVPYVLPNETIEITPIKRRRKHEAILHRIIETAPERVVPECPHFGVCGGCVLQHLAPEAQLAQKAKILMEDLRRIGKVEPKEWHEPMHGTRTHYRRKARPGVKLVPKKGGILVGFRERGTSYITSLQSCIAMDKRISDLLPALHEVIEGLSCPDRIPQLEIAAADNAVAYVMRHLDPLTSLDEKRLADFATEHGVQWFLQPGGLDTIAPLMPEVPEPLNYSLPSYNLVMEFEPTDFIQVNAEVNEMMLGRAIKALDLQPEDKVLDLFCGLGNFTLPVARHAAHVHGVEGDTALVQKGEHNARLNKVENATFEKADLYLDTAAQGLPASGYDKLLLDPPRSGAEVIVRNYVPILKPERIVYVSCNPSTLARDAAILVHEHGYTLESAGAIDMFPHTAHVESIAVFSK